MMDFTLTDLVDKKTLQKIQDSFSKATGMAALTLDLNGPVTTLSGATEFCANLTRKTKLGFERCNKCDINGGEQAARTGRACVYNCESGLIDFAAPIMVNGVQIGTMVGGQVLSEKPDDNKFRKIAREIGVDEEKYIMALHKVKIMPRTQIDSAAEFLFIVANTISQVGYNQLMAYEKSQKLQMDSQELVSYVNKAEQILKTNSISIKKLTVSFSELKDLAESATSKIGDTKDTVKVIQDIAQNTRILGFNASIEASRAKESGKGFGVIAQEVRSLADVSKVSAEKIEEIIQGIDQANIEINEMVSSTNDVINNTFDNLNEITKMLAEIKIISEKLV